MSSIGLLTCFALSLLDERPSSLFHDNKRSLQTHLMVTLCPCSRTQKNRSAYVSTDKYTELCACACVCINTACCCVVSCSINTMLCDKLKKIAYLTLKKIIEMCFSNGSRLLRCEKLH